MTRTKGSKNKDNAEDLSSAKSIPIAGEETTPKIDKLAIDYPSEGLNNMARKINEIIDRLHG